MDIDLDVLQKNLFSLSEPLPEGVAVVKGYDFNEGINYQKLFDSLECTGFQATNLGLAIKEVNAMLKKRTPVKVSSEEHARDELAPKKNCTIFLGFTSNMISSGIREIIRFLIQHNLVDCVVTTAGGIEEDIIKCLAPTHIGDFHFDGKVLRGKGLNRIGNLLVPNKNYCMFEDWLLPLLDTMLQEQTTESRVWSPSKIISRLGQEINNPDSICYWAHKNNIPVFSPAITDGSLGDIMYFHSIRSPGLTIDILQDLRKINTMAVKAVQTGMVILGGGLVKHHISNANLMRNGADHAVFINTGNEFDGSDSGARPDEAISWGKIQKEAKPVKVFGDATIVFPILVSQTFAKYHHSSNLVQ